jgi:hypothetical protein
VVLQVLANARDQPIRRLSDFECDLLEYAGPLTLARREYRFIIGTWRPSKTYVVIQHPDRTVMTCTRQQLEERGIAIP